MKTVSILLLQDWLTEVRARGHDLKPILKDSGIPWRRFQDSRTLVTGEQLGRLSQSVRHTLNDMFIGYGQNLLYPALLDKVLIKILAHSRNLQEVMFEWRDFYNLVQSSGTINTRFVDNELIWSFAFKHPQKPGAHAWLLDNTMLKLRLFSWMTGREIKLKSIGFAEAAPACAGEYSSLAPTRVYFDQCRNFFTIDKAQLSNPVIRTVEECINYKNYMPEDFFLIPGEERLFARRVEKAMRELQKIEFRLPRIESIAEEMSLSVRGLRRKLDAEGESYQCIKNRVRCDLATEQLVRSDSPVQEIADDLGFSCTEAFSRAFKTWTNMTPREYRSLHQYKY